MGGLADRDEIENASSRLLSFAKSKPDLLGADVLFSRGETFSLSLLDGSPEENTCGAEGGISLRCVAKDGRQGLSFANMTDGVSLRDLMEWSYANCAASEPDEGVSLPKGPVPFDETPLELFDESLSGTADGKFRMKICETMHEIAANKDPRVVSVRSAAWSHGTAVSYYASTEGISFWRQGTNASCGVSVVMKDADAFEIGAHGKVERFMSDLDASEIARAAVERTLRILGGRPVPTGKYTLVLEPEVTASLIDEIGDMFCASEIHKGRSLMAGRLGSEVAAKSVTLVDDARIPRKLGTAAVDAEGVLTGHTVLIDGGLASAYMYNLQHAAKDGVKSTGNASRGFASLPDVSTSNLILRPGTEPPESLMKNVRRGVFVTELMGLHTINSVTGDFSLGAKGVYIESGELRGAVAGITIADNLMDFLKKIVSVGNDLTFFGSTGAPTVIVEGVAIAGE
ncbi:MAG: TldD/PmbA family protein [Synergistaceae bacterium]|nr:TldD/PmbA family protein [Synergistaceae bacterium]